MIGSQTESLCIKSDPCIPRLTLRRLKQKGPAALDVPDLAQTVKISLKFSQTFLQVLKTPNKYLSASKAVFNPEKKFEIRFDFY